MIKAAIALSFLAVPAAQAGLECSTCHRAIAASFTGTAHANTLRQATGESILGSFDEEVNTLRTSVPGVYFRMEKRVDGFYQTGFESGRAQTGRFDLVIGSGRRGQSFLYWRDGLLFQLPVSYHAGSQRWINSPGFEDGKVHFGRGIPPQCLDCHASGFRLEQAAGRLRYAEGYSLGIGCAKCHGQAERHERIVRPSGIDLCARCHSGIPDEGTPASDVHGNQVGLLKSSRCFQRSGSMTCSTCHDVHRVERDPATLSARCGACHDIQACPIAAARGEKARAQCVDCHMPLQQSKTIAVQAYRTHRIAVYTRK
ncbi:MAG TPA: multiheme c-type cytochrome [Bryobacteraceae bacterium]|nr:multiheme c-type cytochrome [Bryobacteraceae bacterium]